MKKIELNLNNQDIIEVNGELFQYLSFKRISASAKTGIKHKKVRSFRKITKKRAEKFLDIKVCGPSMNNPSCQTSDGTVGKGGF